MNELTKEVLEERIAYSKLIIRFGRDYIEGKQKIIDEYGDEDNELGQHIEELEVENETFQHKLQAEEQLLATLDRLERAEGLLKYCVEYIPKGRGIFIGNKIVELRGAINAFLAERATVSEMERVGKEQKKWDETLIMSSDGF